MQKYLSSTNVVLTGAFQLRNSKRKWSKKMYLEEMTTNINTLLFTLFLNDTCDMTDLD